MSFMGDLSRMASEALGNAQPQAASDAAATEIASTPGTALADHLIQSVAGMDTATRSTLGQQLLQTYTNKAEYDGDANTATQEAGVSQAAVAVGDPGALSGLLEFAKMHPDVLKSAASSFVQKNPDAIGSLAPGLLKGILGRLGTT